MVKAGAVWRRRQVWERDARSRALPTRTSPAATTGAAREARSPEPTAGLVGGLAVTGRCP